MLRAALIVAIVVLLAVGGALVMNGEGEPGMVVWLGCGVFAVAALVFERTRYKRLLSAPPGPGWSDTGERFVDRGTHQNIAVFYNAATGKRVYVIES